MDGALAPDHRCGGAPSRSNRKAVGQSAHLERPEVEVWIAYLEGVTAGYVELEHQPEGAGRTSAALDSGGAGPGIGRRADARTRRRIELGHALHERSFVLRKGAYAGTVDLA